MKEWLPFAVVLGVGLARALTAAEPERFPPADESLERSAFLAVASEEGAMRREAAKTFPTDLWSRDDDFHLKEWRKAHDWASAHRVPPGDVLRAIDEGVRGDWPHGNSAPPIATTPPCRPRAIY